MLNTPYIILSLSNSEYTELQKTNLVTVPNQDSVTYERGLMIIIYSRDDNMLVAEYDLEEFEVNGSQTSLHLEPIYNSPRGLLVTDLLLLVLPSYSLEEWKEKLQEVMFSITERDFNEIADRLKH